MSKRRRKLRMDITRETPNENLRRLYPEITENARKRSNDQKRRAKQLYRDKRARRAYIPTDPTEYNIDI